MTTPIDATGVPTVELSVTVAAHLDAWLTTTALSHVTVVLVDRGFTVMVAGALTLVLWVESPP